MKITKYLFLFSINRFYCVTSNCNKKYYIKNNNNYDLQFLCFSEKECYSLNANIIEVKNKKFVGFGAYHYYDLGSYKHDNKTNTYSVDVLVDRDPSTDLDVCNKCPFDRGNITHLIFSLIYKPFPKKFKATYKGFVSSEDIVKYENGKPTAIYGNYLNIYYDSNPENIKDLSDWLNLFNKRVAKTFGKHNGYTYDVDIKYIIPYYISNNNVKQINNIQNTNFINKGYLYYDLKSYNYNVKNDTYTIDVMEELDPGGDLENIKCPYGEGFLTHLIYSTKYSPEHKIFNAKYKGFMCSVGEYQYKNSKPISFNYIYKGVYYDSNPSIIPNFNMEYFNNLKKEIDEPNKYNYFGVIKDIKN